MNQELRNSGKETEIRDAQISSSVIESAIRVHKSLGPGFLESFYEEALALELMESGIPFERQKSIVLKYKGSPIGEHRLDLLVCGKLVVELKAIKELEPIHFSIVRSYMKAVGLESGLILNFGTMPLGIKRVAREHRLPEFLSS
jgi:GxxExxY protein